MSDLYLLLRSEEGKAALLALHDALAAALRQIQRERYRVIV